MSESRIIVYGLEKDTGNLVPVSVSVEGFTLTQSSGYVFTNITDGQPGSRDTILGISVPAVPGPQGSIIAPVGFNFSGISVKQGVISSGDDNYYGGVTETTPTLLSNLPLHDLAAQMDVPINFGASTTVTLPANANQMTNPGFNFATILVRQLAGTSVNAVFELQECINGEYFTILSSATLVTGTSQILRVGPGLPATANVSVNAPFPSQFRVRYTGTGTAAVLVYANFKK